MQPSLLKIRCNHYKRHVSIILFSPLKSTLSLGKLHSTFAHQAPPPYYRLQTVAARMKAIAKRRFETLEARHTMDAGIMAVLADGRLTITGTDAADEISIVRRDATIEVLQPKSRLHHDRLHATGIA